MEANDSLYEVADQADRLKDAPMFQVVHTIFSPDLHTVVGAKNLNSCSVVAIYSEHAAIMAHVPPCMANEKDEVIMDGNTLMISMMNVFEKRHDSLKRYFQGPKRACAFFAYLPRLGRYTHGTLKVIVENTFRRLDINIEDQGQYKCDTYTAPPNEGVPGYGTVVIEWMDLHLGGGLPRVFLENRLVHFDGWSLTRQKWLPILRLGGHEKQFERTKDDKLIHKAGGTVEHIETWSSHYPAMYDFIMKYHNKMYIP